MELRQELKMHFTDMKSSWKTAKDFRPTWSWVMVVFLVGVAFTIGFANGITTEMREGFARNERIDATWRMMEIAAEAKGDSLLTERFRRWAVDFAVVEYAQRMNRPLWKQVATDFFYTKVLRLGVNEEKELDMLRKVADQRLTLLPKPQPTTLEILRQRGQADMVDSLEQQYVNEAVTYSKLLGHEINPSALLTDADLRGHLRQVDLEKGLAASK